MNINETVVLFNFFRDLWLWKQILEFMLTPLLSYIVRYCGYSQGMPQNTL